MLFLIEGGTDVLLDPLRFYPSRFNDRRRALRLLASLTLPLQSLISWNRGFGHCCFSLNLIEYQVSEQKWVYIVCLFLWSAPEVHTLNLFDILQDKTPVREEKIKEQEKGLQDFLKETVSKKNDKSESILDRSA